MKKILVTLTAFMFMLFSLFIQTKTTNSAGTIDQQCMLMSGETMYQMAGRDESLKFSQTFTPSQNRLTGVKLFLNGDGKGQVYVDLEHGGVLVASSNTVNEPVGWGISTFTFSDIAITPSDNTYELVPRLGSGNTSLFWYYKVGCYSGGRAYVGDGLPTSGDFGFATYGYNAAGEPAVPPETVTPPDNSTQDNQTNETAANNISTSTTGEKPKEPSKDIGPPKNLSASPGSDSILLRWEPSTTQEVDGYKIFRSMKEKEGFESLGEVSGNIYEFKDAGVEKEKTYYYFVRATVGTEKESESSNTVGTKTKTSKNTGVTTNKNTSLMSMFLGLPLWQQASFVAGIVIVLLLISFLIYRGVKDYRINKELKKET